MRARDAAHEKGAVHMTCTFCAPRLWYTKFSHREQVPEQTTGSMGWSPLALPTRSPKFPRGYWAACKASGQEASARKRRFLFAFASDAFNPQPIQAKLSTDDVHTRYVLMSNMRRAHCGTIDGAGVNAHVYMYSNTMRDIPPKTTSTHKYPWPEEKQQPLIILKRSKKQTQRAHVGNAETTARQNEIPTKHTHALRAPYVP